MKFMMTFSIDPSMRDEALARFKKTGAVPPKGVKLLGRWVSVDFSGGFDLLESDDPKALAEFSLMWSDLLEQSLIPVLEEPDITNAVKSMK